MSLPLHRLEIGGVPQEQYNIHASQQRWAIGTRHDPFRYGLKPIRYRVLHFGHSTQWRIRDAMVHERFTPDVRKDVSEIDAHQLDIRGP